MPLPRTYMMAAVFLLTVSMVSPALAKSPAGADSTTSRLKVVWKDDRLSVVAERVSLSQVLGEIARETGLEIRCGHEVLKRKVSANFSRVSLLEGLNDLLGPLSYALLEKAPSGGRKPDLPFALIVLPQRVSTSSQIASKPAPAVIASNQSRPDSEKTQATNTAQGGTQLQSKQAAAATTSDGAVQPRDEQAADAATAQEANPGDSQAAQSGATQAGGNAAAPEPPPPALPDEGVDVAATNQSAPAVIPGEGIAMDNRPSGPVGIPDDGVNLELQNAGGGGEPAAK